MLQKFHKILVNCEIRKTKFQCIITIIFFTGLGLRSSVFRVNVLFWERKRAICSFTVTEWVALFTLLIKSNESNSLFCFGPKKWTSRVKRINLKFSLQYPLLKRANRSFAFYYFALLRGSTRAKEQRVRERKSEFPTLFFYNKITIITLGMPHLRIMHSLFHKYIYLT